MFKQFKFFFCMFISIMFFSSISYGGGAHGKSEFLVNDYTTQDQEYPSVANLNDTNFIITYTSDLLDTSGTGVFAQIFNQTEGRVGPEFQINTEVNDDQKISSVTSLKNGNVVVTWSSNLQDNPDGCGVYAKIFNRFGGVVVDEFQVNEYVTSHQQYPIVKPLNNGNFIIVWQSYGQDGAFYSVYGRIFDPLGNNVVSEFRINANILDCQGVSTTVLPNGNFVVVWRADEIKARVFNESGTEVVSEFEVNTETADSQFGPKITSFSNSDFVVVWDSNNQDGSGLGIFGQKFDSSANPIGDEFQVNTYTIGEQSTSSITTLHDDYFIVTWRSLNQDGSIYGVYGQIFDLLCQKAGDEFLINETANESQKNPFVIQLRNKEILVTWESSQDEGTNNNVYARIFDSFVDPSDGADQVLDYIEEIPAKLKPIKIFSIKPNVNATMTLSDSNAGTLNSGATNSSESLYDPVLGEWHAWGSTDGVNALLSNLTFTPNENYYQDFNISSFINDEYTNATGLIRAFGSPQLYASNTNQTLNYIEDFPAEFTPITLFSPRNDVNVTMTLSDINAGSIYSDPVSGTTSVYDQGFGTWKASGEWQKMNNLLGNLTFIPAENYDKNFNISVLMEDGVSRDVVDNINVFGTPINDPSQVDTTQSTLFYGCNSINVDQNLNVTDVDNNNLQSAKIKINGDMNSDIEYLEFINQNGITGSYDAINGELDLSGAATKENYQTALRSIKYRNEDTSLANKTINVSFKVNDGADDSNVANRTITVSQLRALNSNQTLNYIEDTPVNFSPITLISSKSNVNISMTLSDVNAGSIYNENVLGTTSVYDDSVGTWKAWGEISKINTLLGNLTFVPAENYDTNFDINVLVKNGKSCDVADTMNVFGTPVNDPPQITTTQAALSYDCGSKNVDPNLNVVDIDNSNLQNAKVRISGNINPDFEYLEFTNQNGITGSYDQGRSELSLDGTSTVGNYQTALRSVKYKNISPFVFDKNVTVSFVTNDGSLDSNVANRTIVVSPVETCGAGTYSKWWKLF